MREWLTTNTRKCIVLGACVGMIILDVVLMVASNVDHMENGYSTTDSKLVFMDTRTLLINQLIKDFEDSPSVALKSKLFPRRVSLNINMTAKIF